MSLLKSASEAVEAGKSGVGVSRRVRSATSKVRKAASNFVRDPTSVLPGTDRGFFHDTWRSVEKRVSGFFKPDMPDIPVPPTMGAPIRHTSRPTTTASDALFGRATGHRAVRTRGPTALTRRRS